MKTAGFVFIILCMVIACSEDSAVDKYNKLVKKELGSNQRVDSVFLGINLGMAQQRFFMHCWEMNKKGIFTDGNDLSGSMTVLYKLPNELKYPASMNFYPDFQDSTIWKMRVSFHYDGWMPWNKSLGADSLLQQVVGMYKKWYSEGNSFIQIDDEKRGTVYVKVDGNRRITIKKHDDVAVKVEYVDMLVEKQIKDKNAK